MIVFLKILFLATILIGGANLTFGGAHLNAERLLTALSAVPILYYTLFSVQFNSQRHSSVFKGFYYAWAIWLLVPLFGSGTPIQHLNGLAISIAPIIPFLLFSRELDNQKAIKFVLEPALWLISLSSIIVYFLWKLHPTPTIGFFLNRDRVKLLALEPNILGSTLAFLIMLYVPKIKLTIYGITLSILSVTSFLLTFSKGPYIALIICGLFYLILTGFFSRRPRLLILSLAAGMAAIVVASSALGSFYSNFLDRQDALNARVLEMGLAFERFLDNPIIGNGPLDFAFHGARYVEAVGSEVKQDAWIGQMMLSIAHDSGVIGLILYLTFLLGIVFHGLRLARRTNDPQRASYLCAFLAVVIASQFTTVHLTALFGVAAGLVASGLQPDRSRSTRNRGNVLTTSRTRLRHSQANNNVGDVVLDA